MPFASSAESETAIKLKADGDAPAIQTLED
jgi:hypothetical protein